MTFHFLWFDLPSILKIEVKLFHKHRAQKKNSSVEWYVWRRIEFTKNFNKVWCDNFSSRNKEKTFSSETDVVPYLITSISPAGDWKLWIVTCLRQKIATFSVSSTNISSWKSVCPLWTQTYERLYWFSFAISVQCLIDFIERF